MSYFDDDLRLLSNPTVNPRDFPTRYEASLYLVRLDDRGDLCVFAWATDADSACEIGEEHAERQGWEVDPEDVVCWECGGDVYMAVLARDSAADGV